MQYLIPLLVVALASMGAATPIATPAMVPRACSTAFPSLMNALLSSEPDQSLPFLHAVENGVQQGSFNLSQDSRDASNPLYQIQFLDFEIPSGSYGCQLHVMDSGETALYKDNSTVPTIKIESFVPNAFQGSPSYSDVVNVDSASISTIHYGELQVARGTSERIINSAACPKTSSVEVGHLQFALELRDHDAGTDSWFTMTERSANHPDGLNGFFMTYNC